MGLQRVRHDWVTKHAHGKMIDFEKFENKLELKYHMKQHRTCDKKSSGLSAFMVLGYNGGG